VAARPATAVALLTAEAELSCADKAVREETEGLSDARVRRGRASSRVRSVLLSALGRGRRDPVLRPLLGQL
ncbi:MAG: hypothetical protein WD064_04585, partial [Acidimicrobiia bacterium]